MNRFVQAATAMTVAVAMFGIEGCSKGNAPTPESTPTTPQKFVNTNLKTGTITSDMLVGYVDNNSWKAHIVEYTPDGSPNKLCVIALAGTADGGAAITCFDKPTQPKSSPSKELPRTANP